MIIVMEEITPAVRAWSGIAFERVCLEYTAQIKAAMAIPATGRKWDNGTVTKEATATEAGDRIVILTILVSYLMENSSGSHRFLIMGNLFLWETAEWI